MTQLAIHGGRIIVEDRILDSATLSIESGRISALDGSAAAGTRGIGATDCYISPGFIDIHVHGGRGSDFMDGTTAAVANACRAHLRHGTTTIFPTTATGSSAQINAMLVACQDARSRSNMPHLPGIHLYGPFFAANKVGCHSLDGRRDPTASEFESYFATGEVRIATCAAELQGADTFFKAAQLANCLITCGHSNCSWDEMQSAFENGMRHVDHFWCAMSSVPTLRERFGTPMRGSMTEFVLMNDQMSTEVIADGHHLAAELLEFAYRMIGSKRLCLVTDCNRALDMPPGDFRFGNEQDGSWLYSDGQVGWAPDRSSLASSIVGMDHMVRHMFNTTSATLPEVIRMATLTPAERTGIATETGSIEVGKRADLLVLDADLNVKDVIVAGRQIAFN